MPEFIYRIKTWRFGLYPIEKLEVVKKTEKTVVVKIKNAWGQGETSEDRYALESRDYQFFDTLKEAEHVAENLVANRMQESITRADKLRERLQEICKHKAINIGGKCIRCDFRVSNPQDYTNGGG